MDSLDYIRGRLSAPGVNLREVAEAAGVKQRWLRYLIAGRIPEPGYGKVKALHDYLHATERHETREAA